jgi:hypothetical protein
MMQDYTSEASSRYRFRPRQDHFPLCHGTTRQGPVEFGPDRCERAPGGPSGLLR